MDVYELSGTPTRGLVTVSISKDPLVRLSFDRAATLIGGKMVQNSNWTFDGDSDDNFYRLTTRQAVEAGSSLSAGLMGVLSPGNTKGSLTISSTISELTGDEQRLTNNTDSDKINYFNK